MTATDTPATDRPNHRAHELEASSAPAAGVAETPIGVPPDCPVFGVSRRENATSRRTRRRQAAGAAAVANLPLPIGVKLALLFVFRESSARAFEPFKKLFSYNLKRRAKAHPEAQWMLDNRGYELVTESGQKLLEAIARLDARPLFGADGSQVGWLVIRGDVGFVLALASAAMGTGDEQATSLWKIVNNFTVGLARVIRAHQPALVVTGDPTRLIRLFKHSETLRDALRFAGSRLEWDSTRHPRLNMNIDQDLVLFAEVARWCEDDYWSTVCKLQKAQLEQASGGLYPSGANGLPPFYVKVEADDDHPAGVAYNPDHTRALLRWIELGALGYDDQQIADALIAEGIGPAGEQAKANLGNPDATLADYKHPAAAVAGWYDWLGVLETGFYHYQRLIPMPLRMLRLEEGHHYKILDVDGAELPEGNEERRPEERIDPYLHADLEFGKVVQTVSDDAGTEKTVEGFTALQRQQLADFQAHRHRQAANPAPPARSGFARPFDNEAWTENGVAWRISGRDSTATRNRYQLWAHPADRQAAAVQPGVVLSANAVTLQTDIARTAAARLEEHDIRQTEVLPYEPPADGPAGPDSPEAALEAARVQMAADTGVYTRTLVALTDARAEANEQTGATKAAAEAAVAQLETRRDAYVSRIRDLEAQITALEAQVRSGADTFDVARSELVDVLTMLVGGNGNPDGKVPAGAMPFIRLYFSDLRLRSAPGGQVAWSCQFHIRTTFGPRSFPLEGRVPAAAYNIAGERVVDLRAGDLAGRFLAGEELSELAAGAGLKIENAEKDIRRALKALVPGKGPRAAIVDSPNRSLRRVFAAYREAVGDMDRFVVPGGLSEGYCRTVINRYTAKVANEGGQMVDPGWGLSYAGDNHQLAWAAVDYVVATTRRNPDEGVRANDVLAALGITSDELRTLTQAVQRTATTQAYEPVLEVVPWLGPDGQMHTDWRLQPPAELMRVRARRCEVCDARTATHVLRVLEVPETVICLGCMTSPGDPACVYPRDDYAKFYSGPRGRLAVDGAGQPTGTIVVARPMTAAEYKAALGGQAGQVGRARVVLPEAELRRLYQVEGWTQAQIAARYGTIKRIVKAHLDRFGIPTNQGGQLAGRPVGGRRFVPRLSKAECQDLYELQGLSLKSIGARCEPPIDSNTVRRHLDHHGIEVRPRGRGGKRQQMARSQKPAIDRDVLVDLYVTRNLGHEEVARVLGCSAGTVTRNLRIHGIEVRQRGRHASS